MDAVQLMSARIANKRCFFFITVCSDDNETRSGDRLFDIGERPDQMSESFPLLKSSYKENIRPPIIKSFNWLDIARRKSLYVNAVGNDARFTRKIMCDVLSDYL